MTNVKSINGCKFDGESTSIPTDLVLVAAQYYAFYKDDSETGMKLLMKVQQSGLEGLYTPFYEGDFDLFEKLQEFSKPEVFDKARVDLFTRAGLA